MQNLEQTTDLINSIQTQIGAIDWGYTEQSESVSYKLFLDWVNNSSSEALGYLKDERGLKRKNLKEFFPQFAGALVFLFPYRPKDYQQIDGGIKFGHYIFGFEGKDYHLALKKRLDHAKELIQKDFGAMAIEMTLDIQPVMERDLAYRAGLGWVGKNSMLIHPKHGSYFIIGSLLLGQSLALASNEVFERDHCGQCTRCADACPTDAIDIKTRTLIVDQCISQFSIEEFKPKTAPKGYLESNGEVFGCDICQDICPWNSKIKPENLEQESEEEKLIIGFFLNRPLEVVITELESMSNRQYRRVFMNTPLARTGRVGMLKNLYPFLD